MVDALFDKDAAHSALLLHVQDREHSVDSADNVKSVTMIDDVAASFAELLLLAVGQCYVDLLHDFHCFYVDNIHRG